MTQRSRVLAPSAVVDSVPKFLLCLRRAVAAVWKKALTPRAQAATALVVDPFVMDLLLLHAIREGGGGGSGGGGGNDDDDNDDNDFGGGQEAVDDKFAFGSEWAFRDFLRDVLKAAAIVRVAVGRKGVVNLFVGVYIFVVDL